jgi:hypothetical protein
MKSLPRAKPGSPGTVSPGAWNLLVQTVEETVAKVARITPKSSPDIIHRASLTGFTSHLTRRQGNGGGSTANEPLTPFIFDSGEDKKLAITAGLIDSITPTFDAELLTADPAPSVTITAATKLWLVLEFEPESENEGSLHWIAPGGTLISAEFELSATQPAETAANVTEAGVVTNGVYSILWAEITVVSDVLTLAVSRTGNRITGFCPPNVLTYFPG